jgi:site-specific DNA-methyltransferase (adenine-specific)
MWCDQEIWPTLYMFARSAGFSVCDWPFTWCKTHPCSNQQAQANFTKATEIAMICRKGKATLRFPQARNWWSGTFALGEREQFAHPFVKPKALWDILLQAIVEPGQTILEPFAGEGSGVLAGLSYGAKVVALEKSDHHFPLLTNNIQQYYKRKFGPQTQFI